MNLHDTKKTLRDASTLRLLALVLPLVAFGGACGSDNDATTASCTIPDTGNIDGTDSCTDYRGLPAASVMQLCSLPDAQYAASACPSANKIAGCSGTLGSASYTRWYYPRSDAATPATAADVMADCASLTPAETFTQP